MEFVIVTGLSGAGKSRAVDVLEDIGFYCIDNMPPKLIPKFGEICMQSEGNTLDRVAIVTDMRGGEMFYDLFDGLEELKQNGGKYKLLFLDANDAVLVRRFKETRRKHPLFDVIDGSVEKAIESERRILKSVRERADYIIDTSLLAPAQLRERIMGLFYEEETGGMRINCMSFGFKHGSPPDADLVFDVRCLPNPYYVDELKQRTGLEEPVYRYVMDRPEAQGLRDKLFDLVDYLVPLYKKEGKSQLVIAVGCTGGKHRSVVFAELLYHHFAARGLRVSVNHRDVKK